MTFAIQSTRLTGLSQSAHSQPSTEQNPKNYRVISHSTGHRLSVSDILLWLLQLPLNSPYRKYLQNTGNLIGRVSWRSSEKLDQAWDADGSQKSTLISIQLPIVHRCFTVQSQRAMGQWTHTFRVTRIVSEKCSHIQLCATNDEQVIRELFNSGMASPFDQTSPGITLLHVRKVTLLIVPY